LPNAHPCRRLLLPCMGLFSIFLVGLITERQRRNGPSREPYRALA